MKDDIYSNALKEVYDILQNTDEELVKKIPEKFIQFIKDNMNTEYKSKIQKTETLDNQKIEEETQNILALIYRSYWATEEEKIEFAYKDQEENKIEEDKKREKYSENDIYKIFEKRKQKIQKTQTKEILVTKKQNFINKIFNKLKNIIKNKKYSKSE